MLVTLMNWILKVAIFPKTIKPYIILSISYPVITSAIVSSVSWNVSSAYDPAVLENPRKIYGVGSFSCQKTQKCLFEDTR